jgi:ABC-type lipoprotein release transport system permease subunit
MRDDYFKDRLISQSFTTPAELSEWLPKDSAYAARVHLPALISTGEQSAPISLEGIDPTKEPEITRVKRTLKAGEFLSPQSETECKSNEIYIGKALAELLNVDVGGKVVLLAQSAEGSLGNDLFHVKGFFDTQSSEFDKKIAYAPIACVQKLGSLKGPHEVAIRLHDPAQESTVIEDLKHKIPNTLSVKTWRDTLPSVASLVTFSDALLTLISFMLLSVISLGAANTILMSVVERTKEFGVILALGITPRQLMLMILTESLVLGAMATVVGTVVGLLAVFYHQKYGFDLRPFLGKKAYIGGEIFVDLIVHPIIRLIPFMKSTLVTVGVTVLAAAIPAYRASQLDPVKTMKN